MINIYGSGFIIHNTIIVLSGKKNKKIIRFTINVNILIQDLFFRNSKIEEIITKSGEIAIKINRKISLNLLRRNSSGTKNTRKDIKTSTTDKLALIFSRLLMIFFPPL